MKKLIAGCIFLFCGTLSFAQIYVPANPTVYGVNELRHKAFLAQHIPEKTDTLTNTNDTTAQIFLLKADSSVWAYYKPRGFFRIGDGDSGGGSGLDSIYVAGYIDTFPAPNGKRGIIVPFTVGDSVKHKLVDTGSTMRDGYVLAFDSTNKKWIMVAPGTGGEGSGTVTVVTATNNYAQAWTISTATSTPNLSLILDTALFSTRLWRQKGIDSVAGLIALKVNISDTGSMLSNYLRKIDTTNNWVSNVTSVNDSTIRVFKGSGSTDILIRGNGSGTGSIGTLDQVLRAGNTTKQMYLVVDSSATDSSGLNYFELRPRNYGRVYSSPAGTGSAFRQGYGYYPGVNADGRPNMVGLLWGYNGGFNSATNANEPTWGVRTETHYQIGSPDFSEFHGVFPEFKSRDGVSRRLYTMYVSNSTGAATATQQIDSYSQFMGATDTVMFSTSPTGGAFGFRSNGSLNIANARVPTNFLTMNIGDGGPLFSGGGLVNSTTYFTFGTPAQFYTSATIGTTQASAISANVGTVNYSGYRVFQTGLASSDFKGLYADVSTTGTFDLINARNNSAGTLETYLQGASGGKVQYALNNGAGTQWNISLLGQSVEKTLMFGVGADSSFKIRGDTKDAYIKYNLSIGTAAPTARVLLPAGTATASTAPLKFTSGTVLTTPETGAIEFNNGLLMLDSSTSVRDTIATRSWARNNIVGGGGLATPVSIANGGSGQTTANAALNAFLPSQTGNAGKFLTTDATNTSWTSAGAGDLLANGTIPLTANWNIGAFNITSTKTGATGNTVYDGFIGKNTTTATTGQQMYGVFNHSIGNGFGTTGSVSQTVDFRWGTVPVQGTTSPTGNFVIQAAINGGAFSTPLTLDNTGNLAVTAVNTTSAITWGTSTGRLTQSGNDGFVDAMKASGSLIFRTNGSTEAMRLTSAQGITFPTTITAGGTTGAQTINKISGSVNFAAAATTLVVTNSLVTTSSLVFVQVYGTDATATTARVTLAAGSFTITLNAAATAETKVGFHVMN